MKLLLAAAMTVATGFTTVAHGVVGDDCPRGGVTRKDGWSSVPVPEFGSGPSVASDWAAAGGNVRAQWITNGTSVLVSLDAGCDWRAAFTVTPPAAPVVAPDPRDEPRVVDIGVAYDSDGTEAFVVVTGARPAELLRSTPTEIHVTRDGGATWERADVGLPPAQRLVQFALVRGGAAYALVDTATVPGSDGEPTTETMLYIRSSEGQWVPSTASGSLRLRGFALGAATAELWAWNEDAFQRSADNGATWSRVEGVTGRPRFAVPASAGRDGGTARPLLLTDSELWRWSASSWQRQGLPGAVESAAFDGTTIVVSGKGRMWVLRAGRPPRVITPLGDSENVAGVVMTGSQPAQVWGYTRAAIFHGRLTEQLGVPLPVPRYPLPSLRPIRLIPGRDALPQAPALRPQSLQLSLRPGESQRVRYTLDIPPTPTPVDVFFVIDTTPSFAKIIADLRYQIEGIVNSLTAAGIDAQFGVGAFRDYPIAAESAGLGTPSNYAYQLVRRIGPVDEDLQDALLGLRTGGGTDDGRTSALAALYQGATGAGQSIAPTAVHDGYVIPPGLDARFRPNSMRVMMLITDTEPRQPSPGYPGPSRRQVADALRARGVHHVGLVVGSPPKGRPGPRETMAELAAATGSVAASDGVDCDGDGVIDLDAGAPLVCDLAGDGLSTAIVEMVRAVRDEGGVELRIGADARGVTPRSAMAYQRVNLKAYTRVPFDIEYDCTAPAQEFAVALAAYVADRVVARANALVRCADPPRRPALAPPPRIVPRVAVAAPPPPPAPPAVNQLPNPNPNTNPQPNPNLQAGAATQERKNVQLAVVEEQADFGEVELAMSALPASRGLHVAWAMGVVLCCAYACRTALRARAAPAVESAHAEL